MATLSERLATVRRRIERAAESVGREPASVRIVAVSKTVPASRVLELAGIGQRVFGENRVQEARAKIPEVVAGWNGPPLVWRMVGHLQRNKVRPAMKLFRHLDGVDSFRLLEAVSAEGLRVGRAVPVLLEFNCSGEATKSGFQPEDEAEVSRRLEAFDGVEVHGLMTIGPLHEDPEAARPAFRRLRRIRDAMADRLGRELPDLSMGMSGDLEIGVEEGATLVRVGTALFGRREG